ncbi:uncharacterized protein LOC128738569 isoform X3 [Sabethes cyaneus]|uniref:uncharacterized protein LOC128738569 isoform X3 n=1 Tax=Sabethes cyaneus TaxID=53552 RepID=UPI00237E6D7F|nr:uncharacterized protein LOC128738569 isoform X3 [Sabethes cyaneus]
MDIGIERNEGGATIGTLFQHIVNDMKNSSPLWDDFIAKATKLHACLRAAIQALAAYLEAFQKIADAATNSKGATKEIGTALTRVCLRHKAVENRMKTFTAAIMDCLIVPLQEKLEDWRKHVAVIDKDHAKEYKRCRAELKKRSSDTLRLQKKAKKGQADNLHILVESSMQDVTLRRSELEEVERKSLRAIMVEERSRYCAFVNMLQPVVHEECEVMSELSHLQEAMQLIAIVTKDPSILPQASEELILESKTNINLYPDSPGGSNSQGGCSNSLGSRKSSVCSISSMNSSSSGSPGHQFQRSLSQYSPAIRLKPGESSDSGFCSSPALTSQASTLASQSHAVSTWPPHTQEGATSVDRPHTISSAYEKGHQRPALTVYTFQNPETISENQKSPANIACRPPLPVRCSSLERPLSTASIKNSNPNVPRQCPSPIPAHITKEHPQLQPTYVNMTELASMAATKVTNNHNNNATNQSPSSAQTPLQPQAVGYQQLQQPNSPVLSSASSLISPDSCATNAVSSPDVSACSTQTPHNTPQTGSPETPVYSVKNTVATGDVGVLESGLSSVVGGDIPSSPKLTATIDDSENNIACNKPPLTAASDVLDDNPAQTHINNQFEFATDTYILKSTGSVLEKTSMFEQQINSNQHQQQVSHNPTVRHENIYGHKGEDIYKSATLLAADRDSGTSRVARRSSVNTVKPPPPVRRSSSVTPNPNLGTSSPNLVQQSIVYTSSESLPPPPAYLLDSNAGHSPVPGNVAGTVKALNEIRHKPASPSVLRRIPHNMPNQQQSSTLQHPINVLSSTLIPESSTALPYTSQFSPPNSASYSTTSGGSPNMSANRTSKSVHHQQGIYAQPKQITSMSSFRATSPGPQKQNSGLLAQLNARINPGKTQQQSSPQHYQSQQQQQSYTYTTAPSNESLFQRNQAEQRGTPNIANQQQPQASSLGIYSSAQHSQVQHQQQTSHYHYHQQQHHSTSKSSGNQRDDYQNRTNSGNASNTSNVLAKTSAGFLENLNARLAEQRLSGKAFAVRNLINSKALPDPRICHESLMDQIKRGATLKRNRTINDRSAPKIH